MKNPLKYRRRKGGQPIFVGNKQFAQPTNPYLVYSCYIFSADGLKIYRPLDVFRCINRTQPVIFEPCNSHKTILDLPMATWKHPMWCSGYSGRRDRVDRDDSQVAPRDHTPAKRRLSLPTPRPGQPALGPRTDTPSKTQGVSAPVTQHVSPAGVESTSQVGTPNLFSWRNFDPTLLPEKSRDLATELTTYRDRLDDILSHAGKFVLIKGEEIIGYYDTAGEALTVSVGRFGRVPSLIKKVTESQEPLRFENVR